jgi:ribose transport system substrate-binding protein
MKVKAVIVLHYGGNDWSRAQVSGLTAQFASMGIEVIATADAGFRPEKQVADIEAVLAQSPNIIVSIPTDPVAPPGPTRKAAEKGVKLVFTDNVPTGLVAGKDYVSVVSANDYGNGVASAHLMGQALGGKGEIEVVFHASDFFVTQQRYEAFKKRIAENYPDIKIAAEQGISGSVITRLISEEITEEQAKEMERLFDKPATAELLSSYVLTQSGSSRPSYVLKSLSPV